MPSASWIKLACFVNLVNSHRIPRQSQPVIINDFEFAVWSNQKSQEIHKYNIYKDKWDKWVKLTNLGLLTAGNIGELVYDKNQCKLYIHSGTTLVVLNTDTKQYKIYKNPRGRPGKGLFIDDKYHIIGAFGNQHLIWNEKKEIFDQQREFKEFANIFYHSLIHVKSKNMLLFMGGMYCDPSGHPTYSLKTIYSINLDTWKCGKLQQTLPRNLLQSVCVGSRNHQFILIFGGTETLSCSSITDKIHILNTKTMTFTESAIKCPIKGIFHAINMNNPKKEELLNCGYIRYLFSLPQFDHLLYPPFYLEQIIGKYFSLEMIHLLNARKGDHWKINIDEIIINCSK